MSFSLAFIELQVSLGQFFPSRTGTLALALLSEGQRLTSQCCFAQQMALLQPKGQMHISELTR